MFENSLKRIFVQRCSRVNQVVKEQVYVGKRCGFCQGMDFLELIDAFHLTIPEASFMIGE